MTRLADENATLTRILGAIDEYVYSGEFLEGDAYVLRFAGPCRERFLGLAPEQARDVVWVDHVHPDDLELFSTTHDQAKITGVLDVQYRLKGADGHVRWVRDRGRVRQVGGRTFLDGSVLDVTALREAEQQLLAHVRDIEVLGAAHYELARSADSAAAGAALCRAVREVCGASAVGLYQPGGEDLVLVQTDGAGWLPALLPVPGDSGVAATYRAGSRTFVADAATSTDVAQPLRRRAGAASVLFEPVRRAGETVGVITVVWAEPVDELPARVMALLPLLGTEAAVALERTDLVQRLSVAAHTDALTGLPNRRALELRLPHELGCAAASGAPLCLAMLDLDHFKAYNDRLGHPAGDALLREAAQRWQATLRSTDALARFGGEEFLAVLPACAPEVARELMDVLRRATPGGQSCSVGVVCWDGAESASKLLCRADQAMYAAKHAGRDRVVAG